MAIVGCNYISLPVHDMPIAIDFYSNSLGLELSYELPGEWAEFRFGPIQLAVYPKEGDEGQGGDIGITVSDLAATMSSLKSMGISFPHGVESFDLPTGKGHLARFSDPSGNRLELIELG